MIAAKVAPATEQMAAKEIWTLVRDSLDDILQSTYEKAGSGGFSVVYNDVEKIPFDLLSREVMYATVDNHIANYFDSSDAADKIGEELLCTNAFMAPIPGFIQRTTVRLAKPSLWNSLPQRWKAI